MPSPSNRIRPGCRRRSTSSPPALVAIGSSFRCSIAAAGRITWGVFVAITGWTEPPIRFDSDYIHVIRGVDGSELDDIVDEAGNHAAADQITRLLRELTRDPGNRLHVSLAGGRKTMGFYIGYALSLYARPQDRLSHVLVNPPFESHPEFFYPPTTAADTQRSGPQLLCQYRRRPDPPRGDPIRAPARRAAHARR